uniref:E3 ubiquitin protein ligase n=1 Tax=Timema poppense TaxID=170557 RepID=A0A7R9CYJ5_TIMPO|nr:unnamed protein product [Timema poppensis]
MKKELEELSARLGQQNLQESKEGSSSESSGKEEESSGTVLVKEEQGGGAKEGVEEEVKGEEGDQTDKDQLQSPTMKKEKDLKKEKDVKKEVKTEKDQKEQHRAKELKAADSEMVRDLRAQLKKALNDQKELKLLLDMYKGVSKESRDKVQLMAAEKKIRAELEDVRQQLKKIQLECDFPGISMGITISVAECSKVSTLLLDWHCESGEMGLNSSQVGFSRRVSRLRPVTGLVSIVCYVASSFEATVTGDQNVNPASLRCVYVDAGTTPSKRDNKREDRKKLCDEDAMRKIKQLEEQAYQLQKQVATQKQVDGSWTSSNFNLMRPFEEEALLNEMEVTGQAFEDMQEQNSRLIQQLREKDDANFKLMTERIKTNQLNKLAREEKDVLKEQVATLTTQVEATNIVVRKLEEKERILQNSLATVEKELALRQQAMEMHKRKAIESAQSAADLKLHLEKYHAQMKEAQQVVAEKTSALEAEAYKTKRLQFLKEAKLPKTKPVETLKRAACDPFLKCKLAFCKTIADESVEKLLRYLMNRCVKPDLMKCTGAKLLSIDTKKSENLILSKNIDVGFATKRLLEETAIIVTERQKLAFIHECRSILTTMIVKLQERSPLKQKAVRGLSSLDPCVIQHSPQLGQKRFPFLLEELNHANIINDVLAENAKKEYLHFCKFKKSQLQEIFRPCDQFSDEVGLDTIYGSFLIGDANFKHFWEVIKICLVLSHGNAIVEGGFSVNKSLLVENMHEKTVTAQRHIHDEIQEAGGIKNIHISKKMLDNVRGARKRYHEYLEMKKQERSEDDKKKAEKRKLDIQVKDLEGKRKKINDGN